MTSAGRPKLRADAERNRDQILAAARKVFALDGPDAPLETIARTAGVGIGTLYRRFPDRETLVRAVARETLAAVLTDLRAAAAEEPAAWDAIVRLLSRSLPRQAGAQLLLFSPRAREILQDDPETAGIQQELITQLDALVQAAQFEGTLRTDVTAGDIVYCYSLILRHPAAVPELAALAFERTATLMVDGLRAQPGSRLPGRPVTGEDLKYG
ncbi:TetR family transcriptional regulator [Amycolatopsis mediterranei S699]|uniref:TetR family transcriptional regulator n=2 Tax=Amycolatopsis mediterranei TaxID=33910 RepID=A0A0H3DAX6_AMYMU|nr:TetR/AcrR family transcriptional regulator [Amycolatopsis mediterranei]ADJ47427.1 TetR family transcriptional regulator [Amycolatopsis mediterranei U32]AEK44274.1 TetR family transcriptional regulator [Amycolatopsis mediterranei S699]AFO79138.1 TetR family transcriptional regulator [Amycolatopsis mediterranei S699]AGT86266.1 TetR family transcriptional regulator [Amycolatopsis mediterranei RB]KDO12647.1 TetR family transcriptional regulator [Amycolatopsis mediterranei]